MLSLKLKWLFTPVSVYYSLISKTINQYNQKATDFFNQYESEAAEIIHNSWASHLKGTDGLALDIGSGSGRDALWLAQKGYEVFAVEPAEKLRKLAETNHHANIH